MAADFSRMRFNPLLDFAGVELKQGCVLLDADFNELVALVDRRLRASASDVLGRATVAATTPGAFKITAAGGTLAIDKGRLYVDGLLAECHGGPADNAALKQFDPLLAEPSWPNALSYTSQPFLSLPPALPTSGKHLVYLDVWQRELTHIERPDLVEVAVNVETSSRRQTVWQVRVLMPDAGSAGCATPDANVAGWAELIAPSVARLSTGSYEPPSSTDPCELPPGGGYRGLENQTYRVEIHDPGLPGGGATFKWSRDNASVANRVTAIVANNRLELASLGRDEVLRFNSGDWVEISDDVREQSQRCGEMRKITVDEAAHSISFTPDLPADLLPASALDTTFAARRNLRVRRWDHKHQVQQVDLSGQTTPYQDLDSGSSGVIKVPAAGTTLVLEHGITVNFGAAAGAGSFHAGDHWVFAARTADASVELLSNEPPRGIHHHYVRLGIWDLATGQVSDCRNPWPPAGSGGDCNDCACTECVTPFSHSSGSLTLQAAVDRVQQRGGGTVCIAIGQYILSKPVMLRNARSLRIRGEGPGTVLIGLSGAFVVSDGMALAIEDLSVLSLGQFRAIQVQTAIGITLQRLLVLVLNAATTGTAIGLSGAVLGATLRENLLIAPQGIAAGLPKSDLTTTGANAAPAGFLLSALLRITDNTLVCSQHAIDFSGLVLHAMRHDIASNDIVGCQQAAINLLGLTAPNGSMRLSGNDIAGSSHGIVAGVDGLWVEDNKLSAARAAQTPTGGGIVLSPGLNKSGPAWCQILANQIRGFERGGVVVAASTGELIVKLNLISHCGLGIMIEDVGTSSRLSVDNNQLSDIGSTDPAKSAVAISVARADVAALAGNSIARVGLNATQALLVAGILAVGVDRLRVAGNSVIDIGPPGNFDRGRCVGVMVRSPFVSADIVHNQIDRESVPLTPTTGRFAALWIDELTGAGNPAGDTDAAGNVTGQTATSAGSTTLVFGMQRAYLKNGYSVGAATTEVVGVAGSSVSVLGNSIRSRGTQPAVRIVVSGDCLFNDNRCDCHVGPVDGVLLACNATIVNANRVRGGEISIRIASKSKKATVLGNITSGAIDLDGPLGAPWLALNVRG